LAGTVVGQALDREIEFFPVRSSRGAVSEAERFTCHPRWFRHFANPGVCGIRFDQIGELPTATIAQIHRNEPDASTSAADRADVLFLSTALAAVRSCVDKAAARWAGCRPSMPAEPRQTLRQPRL
jgi:hypothetical protein